MGVVAAAVVGSAIAAAGTNCASKQAAAAQLLATKENLKLCDRKTGIHAMQMGQPPAPTKCPSCGSHEFRKHDGRRICSYCRTGQ